MDPSGVLLAIEEQKKWRERRERIEERLQQIDRRRAFLLRELEHVRKKVAKYAGILRLPPAPPLAMEPAVPRQSILR